MTPKPSLEPLFYHSESCAQCGGVFGFAADLAFHPPGGGGFDQPHAAQRDASFGRGQRADAALGEMRFERGLMEAATFREIGERMRFEPETVLRHPIAGIGSVAVAAQQDAVSAIRVDAISGAALRLGTGIVKAHGQAESIAETHVGEPWFAEIHLQRQMVERRAEAAGLPGDLRGKHSNWKAQLPQQRAKEAVQLIAEAAPAAGNHLVEKRSEVERELTAQVDVEVLKGNRVQMRQMQPAQRSRRDVQRSGVGEAAQVSRNIHGASVAGKMGSNEGADFSAYRRMRGDGGATAAAGNLHGYGTADRFHDADAGPARSGRSRHFLYA